MMRTPRALTILLVPAATCAIGLAGWIAAHTVFAENIPLSTELPPIAQVVGDAVNVRVLPNEAAEAVAVVVAGQPVYIRCVNGQPLEFGPWVGVIDPRSDALGWSKATFISASEGSCTPPSRAVSKWRLRKRQVAGDGPVNIRFAPAQESIVVGKVRPGAKAWTDGRFVDVDGYRWIPVLTESGVSGWVRGDLIM